MITIEPPSIPAVADEVAALSRGGLTRFVSRAQAMVGLAGSVEVLLTSDPAIKRLNRDYRGKNKATDVLSFPADPMPGLPPEMQTAGDLAVSLDTASRQAAEHGHGLGDELRILLLHGLLHLNGMDHEVDGGEMAAREAELRAKLKLPAGLIARTLDAPAKPKQVALKGRGFSPDINRSPRKEALASEGSVPGKLKATSKPIVPTKRAKAATR